MGQVRPPREDDAAAMFAGSWADGNRPDTREILASLGTLEWERHSYYITVHVYCNVAYARNFPNRDDPFLFLLLSCCFRGRLEAVALLFSWVTLVSQH